MARTFFPDNSDRNAHMSSPTKSSSVFATSPYAAVVDLTGVNIAGSSPDQGPPKRPKIGGSLSLGMVYSQGDAPEQIISERDMVQFIDM